MKSFAVILVALLLTPLVARAEPLDVTWEPYDTSTDPGESKDLAASQLERVTSMTHLFDTWAKRVGVVPREEIVKLMPTATTK